MGSDANILIVEDEEEWGEVFKRAVGAVGSATSVQVAKDLRSAEQLVDAAEFAVAIVDIGLDASDDRNVDGLRVMEKIRTTGDETVILVVTGRSGQDALQIARDALKKYKAFDTVGKSSVTPAMLRTLLKDSFEEYQRVTAFTPTNVREAMRGNASATVWDDQVMRLIGFESNLAEFYGFLDGLFREYLPVIPRDVAEPVHLDGAGRFICGEFWSRAVASAVTVCFGAQSTFDEALPLAVSGLGGFTEDTMIPLRELSSHGAKGCVFSISGRWRDEFSAI